MGRARVWVPGRSEINVREPCNGLPSVVLSFITSSHRVEFVVFVLLKHGIEGEWSRCQTQDGRCPPVAGCMGLRSHLAGRSYHGTNSGVPRIKFSREGARLYKDKGEFRISGKGK